MSLTYVGDCSITEQSDSGLQIDDFGSDALTRKFKGRSDGLDAFLKLYEIGTKDSTYRDLYSLNPDISWEDGFVNVSITFKGIIAGRPRKPMLSGSLKRTTSTLYDSTGNSMEVEYYSPVFTAKYSVLSAPLEPQFSHRLAVFADSFKILGTKGARGTLRILGLAGAQAASEGALKFYGRVEPILSTFDRDQIGVYLWQVTETTEGRIVDVLDDLNRLKVGV